MFFLRFFLSFFIIFGNSCFIYADSFQALEDIPVLYKGRFRPLAVYAQLWLQENKEDQPISDRIELLWRIDKESPLEEVGSSDFIQSHLEKISILFLALPAKSNGPWLPLKTLSLKIYDKVKKKSLPITNFTQYSDEQFLKIQNAYLQEDVTNLARELKNAYASLAGQAYRKAAGKQLIYPSRWQLQAELLYYRYPWIAITLTLYFLAAMAFIMGRKSASCFLLTAFAVHSFILGLRCYILSRPPVSNMQETIIYVPWICVLASLGYYYLYRNRLVLIASASIATLLLVILNYWDNSFDLENVQAVLDSQYWLIIHVLMVVGSYGIFLLSAVIGHFYLIINRFKQIEKAVLEKIGKIILQSLYLGVALLIPGTILGGVWAAESWGRFWDWDPKESWAFISACIYLLVIHAYRFHKIAYFGLAVGSILGILAISFTWYGVNYILGTGLHSYGFGNGGEIYYYSYVMIELLFLLFCTSKRWRQAQFLK